MSIELPTFEEADLSNSNRNAIEEFVWNFQPAGITAEDWREMLQAAISEAYEQGKKDAKKAD